MTLQLTSGDVLKLIDLGVTTVAAIRAARASRRAELEIVDASGQPMTDAQFEAHFAAFDAAADAAGTHAAGRITGRSSQD